MAAANAVAAMTPDGVDFINKDDARGGLLALVEHVADARCADADKHLNKVRAADGEERNICLASDGAREKRFASAGRPDHQHALWNAAAKLLKFFRIAQILDELLHFILGFLDSRHIAKCDFVFVTGEHSRFRFPEIESAFSSH